MNTLSRYIISIAESLRCGQSNDDLTATINIEKTQCTYTKHFDPIVTTGQKRLRLFQ